MKALHASALSLKLGLPMAAASFAVLRTLGPAFFSSGGEIVLFVAAIALATALLGLLFGLVAGERGGAAGAALVAALVGAGIGVLLLPTVSVVGVVGVALASLVGVYAFARTAFARAKGGAVALHLLTLVALGAGLARRPPPSAPPSDHPKIFVFGLDAGTWTILRELFDKDELPNLRRVRDEGASGKLQSEVKSESSRVWTTIATGKWPVKPNDPKAGHGIVDFYRTQNRDLRTRRLWEMLQSKGWSVGLFQWLVTWPPDPFEPFVVPGWDARGSETVPARLSFVKELEMAVQTGDLQSWIDRRDTTKLLTKLRDWSRGYLANGLRLKTVLATARVWWNDVDHPVLHHYAAKRTTQLLINGDVFLQLYRTTAPDFSCFICYGTDNLAHKYWQYHFADDFDMPHEKAKPYEHVLTDYYQECDRLLGEIVPLLPAQTTLAVVSDHGFTSVGENGESHQHEHRPRMSQIRRLLELTEDEVKASSIATHGYFTIENGSGRADEVRQRIVAFLEACTATNGGAKVFLATVDPTGLDVSMNPSGFAFQLDTPVDTPKGHMTYGDLADVEERTGNHSTEGIVLLSGPQIRRGVWIEGARLLDVTPTLLYLHDQPVGADMDGAVLFDAIEPSFHDSHDLERIQSWDDVVTVLRDQSVKGDDRAAKGYMDAIGYTGGDDKPGHTPRPKEKVEPKKDGENASSRPNGSH